MFTKNESVEKAWQILIPENQFNQKFIIQTSPCILGSSGMCDIILDDPSVADEHIQFSSNNFQKAIEILDISGGGDENNTTLIDGQKFTEKKLKSKSGAKKNFTVGDIELLLYFGPVEEDFSENTETEKKDNKKKWYYIHKGKKYGPLSKKSLITAARENSLLSSDDVWNSNINYKMKAFEIPDLFSHFQENQHIGFDKKLYNQGFYDFFLCPYCWHQFRPEEMLFIARHPELFGDPVLGSEEQQRFLPRRLLPQRGALDAKGQKCTDMACPRCHLRIPSPFLDTSPFIISTIGPPGCGKSYFLATSIWRLRKILYKFFNLSFINIDDSTNTWLNDYEKRLFYSFDEEDNEKIEKSQIDGALIARQVKIDDISMVLPLPSILTLLSHEENESSHHINLSVMFYDNAGEHFEAGQDMVQRPGTLHMMHAKGLFFIFDPTSEPEFKNVIRNKSGNNKNARVVYQQQRIILETIDRLRRHMGLKLRERLDIPIVVGMSKADLLDAYFEKKNLNLGKQPWHWIKQGELAALNLSHIKSVSACVRQLFYSRVPEFVNTVESFAKDVIYAPISALGHQPEEAGLNPSDIKPVWTEIPFLYILAENGLIPAFTINNGDRTDKQSLYKDSSVRIDIPGKPVSIEMPLRYSGLEFTCPGTKIQFTVP